MIEGSSVWITCITCKLLYCYLPWPITDKKEMDVMKSDLKVNKVLGNWVQSNQFPQLCKWIQVEILIIHQVAITWLLQACISYRLDEYNQVEKMSAPTEQEKLHSQTTQLRRVQLRSMTAGIEVFQPTSTASKALLWRPKFNSAQLCFIKWQCRNLDINPLVLALHYN